MISFFIRALLLYSTTYIAVYVLYIYDVFTHDFRLYPYSYRDLLIFLNVKDISFAVMVTGLMFPYTLFYDYCKREQIIDYFEFGASHLFYIVPVVLFYSPSYTRLNYIPPVISNMKEEFYDLNVATTNFRIFLTINHLFDIILAR